MLLLVAPSRENSVCVFQGHVLSCPPEKSLTPLPLRACVLACAAERCVVWTGRHERHYPAGYDKP
eukprot:4166526-Pleurochrysis_carterae.AAC.2